MFHGKDAGSVRRYSIFVPPDLDKGMKVGLCLLELQQPIWLDHYIHLRS